MPRNMNPSVNILQCAGIVVGLLILQSSAKADCAGLKGRQFTNTEITRAESVAAGALVLPDGTGAPAGTRDLPALCRVAGVIRATADSEVGFEVWLPEQWNGRFLQTGNGGFAGSIAYAGLLQGIRAGFAVANTDGGHAGMGAEWALGHPEKLIDYGYRAVHLTSVTAKSIVSTYYGKKFDYSYFSGCSNGGRESLMSAQRFPDDFDGWIVGAPANDFTALMVFFLNAAQTVSKLEEPFTQSQLEALSKQTVAACDAKDGLTDGVIDNPLQCKFDPAQLSCKGKVDGQCLSQRQVDAVLRILGDVSNPATKARLTPGLQATRGTEDLEWNVAVTGPLPEGSWARGPGMPAAQFFSEQFYRFMVYADPNLNFKKLEPLQASKDGRSRAGIFVNAVDPDLSTVRASNKKIIQYHGWGDAYIPAQYSIAYYEAVEKYLGRDNRDFYRLFMVPGMTHCGGGPGPNIFGAAYISGGSFDPEHHALAALMQWVEKGRAPERIVATKYQDNDTGKAAVRTRPLCVYPAVARWTGKGSTDDAKNFVCSTK